MEEKNQNQEFHYQYSAEEQDEVQKIRQKYLPKETDKMEQLRRLDASVTKKGTVVSLIMGVLGLLVLGAGMSLVMVGPSAWFIVGIVIGLVGIGTVSAAYPLYTRITEKERKRIAPEIIRLTDELKK